jgi:DNA-binding response OmpR family regulator
MEKQTEKPNVLIVEDNDDLRELLMLYLKCEDFATITAADGYEAVEKLVQHQPKVVLTKGYFTPNDSFGLIKTIRQTAPFENLPVVAMLDKRNGHIPAKEAGATKIVRVPRDYERLPKIIKELLAEGEEAD